MARSTASFGLALSLAVVSVEPALAQLADDTQLSVVDIDGNIAPLTPQQLDANEQPTYAALVPGSAEATRFLYTRAFLRYARLVVDGKLLPEDLPALPDRANWDRTYLSEAEARIVDDALGMNIAAHFNPPVRHGAMAATEDLPAVDAEGNMSPLALEQLSGDERKTFANLVPGSPEATAFLHTRGFLRYARLVVDERLDPDQLPWLPADELWNRDYLSAEEAEQIVDIALAMQIISMLKRPE